jgi:hypothetical protein
MVESKEQALNPQPEYPNDVLAAPALVARPRGDWEAALRKAKASAQPAEFAPCITVYHF